MDASIVAAIAARAASQHGLVTLQQLRNLHITPHQLRMLVRSGWLQPLAPRVYGIAGMPMSIDRRLMLGVLSLGPDAVVSHEAAARLHGFDRCLPDAVEFTVSREHRHAGGPFRVHSTATLPAIDQVRVGGCRCTSATRTIIDLARARVPTVRLEAAIDSAVRSGASAPAVIATRLAALRGRGRWGATRIDILLPDSGGHTLLERRFLSLMRTAGLPGPTPQVVHRDGQRTIASVDFLFEPSAIVVEVSGRRGHASDADRARDAQRRNELQDTGRRVYEYTYQQVTGQREYVTRTMRERLAAAGWSPSWSPNSREGPRIR